MERENFPLTQCTTVVPVIFHLVPGSIETIKRLFPLTNICGFTDIHSYENNFKKLKIIILRHFQHYFTVVSFKHAYSTHIHHGKLKWHIYQNQHYRSLFLLSSTESNLPSNRTRGRSKNISLQDVYGTSLIQLLPQTFKQARRHISGSLGNKSTMSIKTKSLHIDINLFANSHLLFSKYLLNTWEALF